MTSQRRAILAAFNGGDAGHLTAEEVLDRARRELPELARGTVYSTLGELVRVGLLRTVAGPGAQRFDPNLDAGHHHFRCLSCDRLYDIHLDGVDRLDPTEGGFDVRGVQILLEGNCPDCAARDAS